MLFAIALLTLAGGKQPQMAASAGTVALVYGAGHSVMFAKSTDGGASFSTPARIAELPALNLGRHRGPRVAFSGKAIVVSAIDTKNLLAWRSTDNGATWTGP